LSLLAKWPDFSSRNVATLLRREIERSDGPEIWLGATVVEFILQADGRFAGAVSKNMNGKSLRVGARHAVVAAGAIESTRLLLLLDLRHDERIFKPHSVLGRYFYDHISLQTADVQVDDARALNRIIGFRFEGKTMRNLRFVPTAILRKKNDLPNAFLHISFTSAFPSGFDALRAILRRRQEGRVPSGSDLAMLASSLPWLARAVWWRLAKKRLLFPPQCVFHLNTVVEQQPLWRNRMALSSERKDALGVPLATIDWQVSDADARHVIALTEHFVRFWENSVLAPLARLKIKPGLALMDRLADEGGIYHPGGTTRMGKSPNEAVVDKNLQTFAVPNLSILATSVFPTGGGSNPTMTLLMAAFRLADHISSLK
jgi:choline dehydrogenase-like flavoprotein